jgi:O-antigen/teichoic acid export membrane protein
MSEKNVERLEKAHVLKNLAGNTGLNLIGMLLPLVAALFAMPFLVHEETGFGDKRMEVLGIVWLFVGMFGLFDMGLGRALTKMVAEKLTRKETDDIPGLFWTAILMMFCLGLVAAGVIVLMSPIFVRGEIPVLFRNEIKMAFIAVACGMPIIVMTIGLVGVLEACQRYSWINYIRTINGLFTYVGPLCVLPFTQNLFVVVAVLMVVRVLGLIAYFIGCLVVLPELRRGVVFERKEIKPLLTFGGWMTVSNIAVPVMLHMNRLVIRHLMMLGIGVYYMIAEEMAIRFLTFARAWISALFPAFVASFSKEDGDPGRLFECGVKYLALFMVPVVVVVIIVAPLGFNLWLGAAYAENSTLALVLLVVGVYIHGVSRVAWFYVQSAGHPKLTSIVHLIELPLTLICAWVLISRYGVAGAAAAWLIRATVDLVATLVVAAPFVPGARSVFLRLAATMTLAVGCFALAGVPQGIVMRLSLGLSGLVPFIIISWKWLLKAEERASLVTGLKQRLALT